MEAKTQPCQGMLAAPGDPRKLCGLPAVWSRYNPLQSRWHYAASVDGRSPVPSPGGRLPGGDAVAEPLLSSNFAGVLRAKESGS